MNGKVLTLSFPTAYTILQESPIRNKKEIGRGEIKNEKYNIKEKQEKEERKSGRKNNGKQKRM